MINIEARSSKPIFEQVVDKIKENIMMGGLKSGEKMPSIRELSKMLTINPNTVCKAYAELERQKLIETISGKVTFNNSPVFDNKEVKKKIGYTPDFCHYYENFKVKELIEFYKLSYDTFNEKRFDELNNAFEISKTKRVNCLSKGTKAKLMLALSLSKFWKYREAKKPIGKEQRDLDKIYKMLKEYKDKYNEHPG